MEQYIIGGMSCAACQARVENAVSKVDGVDSVSVSLLTNTMGVEGNYDSASVIKAVEDAGYSARPKQKDESGKKAALSAEEDALVDRETPKLKKRLALSVIFLVILMYVSMGHNMAGFPLPSFLSGNFIALALTQMLLSLTVLVINRQFFMSGIKSLLHGAPNMDTLVSLGSGVSFVYSLVILYIMSVMMRDGTSGDEIMKIYHTQMYFESAAMIPAIVTIGKMLEAKSKGKTTGALKSLLKLSPKTANVIRDGKEITIPADEIKRGELFAVRSGEAVPADGTVTEGDGSVDESALSGESVPVDKVPGDSVSAGTINRSGYLLCKAERVGKDTTISQIIDLVSEAAATKAPIARIADRVSRVFVPAVIGIALAVTLGWIISGKEAGFAIARGISVLVISCPCALGLATPVAIMVGNGVGASAGILFKTGEALERVGKIKKIALDKTGTITKGEPFLTGIHTAEGFSEEELISAAFSLESKSEHPLSKAISAEGERRKAVRADVDEYKVFPGGGIEGVIEGRKYHVGNLKFIKNYAAPQKAELDRLNDFSESGKTPVLIEGNGIILGILAISDVIKPDSVDAVKELKGLGIESIMITGDNEVTSGVIAKEAGIEKVFAGAMPQDKEKIISGLKENSLTAMVGDGINDAPALCSADIGIAIGAGTDVAIDSADIVLMNSSLSDVVTAVKLSRKTIVNIRENLFWAFFYNLICIPLAAGFFGLEMNPMIGAAAMSISSVTVCLNALRLNFFKTEKKADNTAYIKKGEKKMTKTVKIEGMMCMHCSGTVKGALEALDFVESAEVSHEKGTADLTLKGNFDESAVKEAVEAKGYKYLG